MPKDNEELEAKKKQWEEERMQLEALKFFGPTAESEGWYQYGDAKR